MYFVQEVRDLEDEQRTFNQEIRSLNSELRKYRQILYSHILLGKYKSSPCRLPKYQQVHVQVPTKNHLVQGLAGNSSISRVTESSSQEFGAGSYLTESLESLGNLLMQEWQVP